MVDISLNVCTANCKLEKEQHIFKMKNVKFTQFKIIYLR